MTKPRFLVVAAFCLCVFCDVWLARALPPEADMVQNYNELFAVRSGNILLHRWGIGADNFYFTDLPFFVLLSGVFGTPQWLIYVEPALVYALLLLAAILLVMRAGPPGGRHWPGALAMMLLIGVPFTAAQRMFLIPSIHTATCMLCLYALLIIQPVLSGRNINRLLYIIFFWLVFAVAASDPLVNALFIFPVLLLILLRTLLHPAFRLDDWMIFFLTLLAAGAGALWPGFIAHNHGFSTVINFLDGFVPDIDGVKANLRALSGALHVLFNARAAALPAISAKHLLAATRLLTAGLALLFCLRVLWRAPRALDQGVAQLLVLCALVLAAADVVSRNIPAGTVVGVNFPGPATRYFAPVFIFIAIAAVIEAQNYVLARGGRRLRLFAGAIAIFFGGVFMFGAGQAVVQAMRQPAGIAAAPQMIVLKFLQARHFDYGVGDYWTANMITALSGNSVIADAVTGPGSLMPYPLNANMARFDAGRRPQFAVFTRKNLYGIDLASVTAAYGAPQDIEQIGGFDVMILPDKN